MTQPLDMPMYGAVDLSSLASNPQRGADGAKGVKAKGPFVVDATVRSLQDVLDVSAKLPVILVFRSARSENSVALDSQMRDLAVRHAGRFQLARVDVDADADIAQAFRVAGVPAAVALLQGQPVPLFQGSPADGELEKVVEQVLATAAQYGMTAVLDGDAEPAPPPELGEHHRKALDALASGDFDAAAEEFRQALKAEPGNEELSYGLAQAELMSRVGAADPESVMAAAADAPPADVEAHLAAADVEIAYGRPQAAFARLVGVVAATSGEPREAARQRLLELFEVVGSGDPVVVEARRALANALF